MAEAIGYEQSDFARHDLYTRLQVAKLNDGQLPVGRCAEADSQARRGRTPGNRRGADEEVAMREWRGASQGFSFRVAKGVRYRVGTTRGHLVTVGTQLHVADTGTLVVTSQRAVFLGTRKTIEMPYAKLIGMNVFTDAISFSLEPSERAVYPGHHECRRTRGATQRSDAGVARLRVRWAGRRSQRRG